jgi:hypothetical protein
LCATEWLVVSPPPNTRNAGRKFMARAKGTCVMKVDVADLYIYLRMNHFESQEKNATSFEVSSGRSDLPRNQVDAFPVRA